LKAEREEAPPVFPSLRASRSVKSIPTDDSPMSRFTRATMSVDLKSCVARSDPFGPGRITLPPPLSLATSSV
jgi:hypothetical protein